VHGGGGSFCLLSLTTPVCVTETCRGGGMVSVCLLLLVTDPGLSMSASPSHFRIRMDLIELD